MHTRLKEARKRLKLSQEFAAHQTGLSQSAVSAIESGQRKVRADELVLFCELYGISADELLYGKAQEGAQEGQFARAFMGLSDADRRESWR